MDRLQLEGLTLMKPVPRTLFPRNTSGWNYGQDGRVQKDCQKPRWRNSMSTLPSGDRLHSQQYSTICGRIQQNNRMKGKGRKEKKATSPLTDGAKQTNQSRQLREVTPSLGIQTGNRYQMFNKEILTDGRDDECFDNIVEQRRQSVLVPTSKVSRLARNT